MELLDKRQRRCHLLRTEWDSGASCLGNLTSRYIDFSDKTSGMNWKYFHVILLTKLSSFFFSLNYSVKM